jgi:hypothetical protein
MAANQRLAVTRRHGTAVESCVFVFVFGYIQLELGRVVFLKLIKCDSGHSGNVSHPGFLSYLLSFLFTVKI